MNSIGPEKDRMNERVIEVCRAIMGEDGQREWAVALGVPLGSISNMLCGYKHIPVWFLADLYKATGDRRALDIIEEIAHPTPRITTPQVARENMRRTNTAATEFINTLDLALEDGRIDDIEHSALRKAGLKLQGHVNTNLTQAESLNRRGA